jgi:hypothetical protein
MADPRLQPELSDSDLEFVIREAAPEFNDKEKLKRYIQEDAAFRKALIGDERVFRKVMKDEEIFLKISPVLYFEILLRKTQRELQKTSHTIEKIGGEQVPVFDTRAVVDLLDKEKVLEYLAGMLASFTRTESYTIPIRVRKGIWRKIRFSDMDIDALDRLCEAADEEHRFSFYKRIADVCLFILGIFPEYAQFDYRYPFKEEPVKREAGFKIRTARKGMQEYEEEGRKFYKLAAAHETAKMLELSGVFQLLQENFSAAKKPLNFISQHYFVRQKQRLFGVEN